MNCETSRPVSMRTREKTQLKKRQWTRRSRTSELVMPKMVRGAKRVSRCEECQHVHERQLRKLHTLTTQQSGTLNMVQKSRSWSVLDLGETFARAVHREGGNFEDLELFRKVLQTRCGNIPVYSDQKECLRDVVHSTAGRLRLPTGATAVERSQANGRAEQRVSAERAFYTSWLRTQDGAVLKSSLITQLHSETCRRDSELLRKE